MTRVLISEFLCSGGEAKLTGETPWASALSAEAWAMLTAAVDDFRRIRGVEVSTLLDQRRQVELGGRWPDVAVTWVPPGAESDAFRAAAATAEYALVIAPEFCSLLEDRCRWAATAGCRLLGPSPDAVALTADKLALAKLLERAGVPTPTTILSTGEPPFPPPWVVKPRCGAGSVDTTRLDGQAPPSNVGPVGERIVQPFVQGQPASVAFLIGPQQKVALPPAAQRLSGDGHCHYLGGHAPLPAALAQRAERIARQAVDAVPGLRGYVGVDVVLGHEDVVIEINPRLTTSYIGLRALTDDNLMGLLLQLVRGESAAQPHWRTGSVSWTADGQVTVG